MKKFFLKILLRVFPILGNQLALVFLLTILGAYFRFWGIWEYHFSADDIIRLTIASANSFGDFIERNSVDTHPPLVYIFLKILLSLNFNDLFLRFVSLIPGVFLIPLSYFLAKEMFDKKVAIIFCFFSAFGYGLILVSQSLRQYMLSLLFLEISIYYLVRFSKSKASKDLWLHLFFGFISVTGHYLMLITLFAFQVVYILPIFAVSKFKKSYLVAFGLFCLLIISFLAFSFLYQGQSQWALSSTHQRSARMEWLATGYPSRFLEFLNSFIMIFSYFSIPLYNFDHLAILIFVIFAFLFGFWNFLKDRDYKLLLVFLIVLILQVFMTMYKLYPFSGTRHAIHIYIPMMLITSFGLVRLLIWLAGALSAKSEFVCSAGLIFMILFNLFFAISNNFYRDNLIASMEFSVTKSQVQNYLDFLNINIQDKDIIICDRQTGLFFGYLNGGLSTKDFVSDFGQTTFLGKVPIYFSNDWGFVHNIQDHYKSSYEYGISKIDYLPTRVWLLSLGWSNFHLGEVFLRLRSEEFAILYPSENQGYYSNAYAVALPIDKIEMVFAGFN
ncbi:MAG: glycosyltransferase family 39 protein [Patescibacteria group bacterium]|nr:glycosyltransferase family 39 protein [Patescibacteria group bacterium]